MKVCSLGSGSKGNALFIQEKSTCILIDAGFSFAELQRRLSRIDEKLQSVQAVFISHAHSDHMCGLKSLIRQMPYIKIFAPPPVAVQFGLPEEQIINSQEMIFGSLKICPFTVPHGTPCFGFSVFAQNGRSVSIVTDIGFVTDAAVREVAGTHLAFIEANHDVDMLIQHARYPQSVKRCILSEAGHLSNIEAAHLIEQIVQNGTRYIVLAHISQNSNTQELALQTVKNFLQAKGIQEEKDYVMTAASQDNPTDVFIL